MHDRDTEERLRSILLQLVLITLTVVVGFLVIDMVTNALDDAERLGAAETH